MLNVCVCKLYTYIHVFAYTPTPWTHLPNFLFFVKPRFHGHETDVRTSQLIDLNYINDLALARSSLVANCITTAVGTIRKGIVSNWEKIK